MTRLMAKGSSLLIMRSAGRPFPPPSPPAGRTRPAARSAISSLDIFLRFRFEPPHSELDVFEQLSIHREKIGHQSNDDELNSRKQKHSSHDQTGHVRLGRS